MSLLNLNRSCICRISQNSRSSTSGSHQLKTQVHKRNPLRFRGAEPKQLAFSTALGVTLGLFPICGVTAFLCGIAIALLRNRCHAPSVMLANFVATPVEISMVIPFLRLGEVISGGPHFPLTSDALKKVVTGLASREILLAVSHALIGWAIAAPFILGMLYIVFVPCFKYLVRKLKSGSSIPNSCSSIPMTMSRSR